MGDVDLDGVAELDGDGDLHGELHRHGRRLSRADADRLMPLIVS